MFTCFILGVVLGAFPVSLFFLYDLKKFIRHQDQISNELRSQIRSRDIIMHMLRSKVVVAVSTSGNRYCLRCGKSVKDQKHCIKCGGELDWSHVMGYDTVHNRILKYGTRAWMTDPEGNE